MLGASLIFVLLSIFYYEYVPEGLFLDNDSQLSIEDIDVKEKGEENDAFEKDDKVNEESDL